jgi:hypothetical protein
MADPNTSPPKVYDSKWDKARRAYLDKHPLCVMCQQQGQVVAATVVDHKVRHGLKAALASGVEAAIALARRLFWDSDNWQSLCKVHHDSTKQRSEKRGHEIGCGDDGIPLDPGHHWARQ